MTEKLTKLTKASLKKLIAARGAEEGFFYFVGTSTLTNAALRVTLKTKDKSGQVVLNHGKAARAGIKGSKFGRGEVTAFNKKVRFILTAGTASREMMQKCLVQILSKEKDAGYLRKARVVLPGTQEEEAPGEELTAEDLAEVDRGLDSREMESLINDQANISGLNDTLAAAFLSKEDAASDFTEQFTAELEELDSLLNDPGASPEAIHAKRLEIAALVEFGEEMDSGFGVPLEIIPVVAAAFNGISNLLFRHLQAARSWLSTTDEALSNDQTVEDVEEDFEVNIAIVENVFEQLQQYASTELR